MDTSNGLGTIAIGSVSELANILSSMSPEQLQNVRLDPVLYNALSQTIDSASTLTTYNINALNESQIMTEPIGQEAVSLNEWPQSVEDILVSTSQLSTLNQQEFVNQMQSSSLLVTSVENPIVSDLPFSDQIHQQTLVSTLPLFSQDCVDTTQLSTLEQEEVVNQKIQSDNPHQVLENPTLSLDAQISGAFTDSNSSFVTHSLLRENNVHSLLLGPVISTDNCVITQQPVIVDTIYNPGVLAAQNLRQLEGILPGQASSLIITPTIMSQVQPTPTVQTVNLRGTSFMQTPLSTSNLNESIQASTQSLMTPMQTVSIGSNFLSSPISSSVYVRPININPETLASNSLNQAATFLSTGPNQHFGLNRNTINCNTVPSNNFNAVSQQILFPSVVGANQVFMNDQNLITLSTTPHLSYVEPSSQQLVVSDIPQHKIFLQSQTTASTNSETSKSVLSKAGGVSSSTKNTDELKLHINPSTGRATFALQNGIKVELNSEQVQNVLSGKKVVATGKKNATLPTQKVKNLTSSTKQKVFSLSEPKTKTIVKTVNVISRSAAQVQMKPKSVEQVQPGVFKFKLTQVDGNDPNEKSITVNKPITVNTVTKTLETITNDVNIKSPKESQTRKAISRMTATPLSATNAAEIRKNIISPSSILKTAAQSTGKISSSTCILSSTPQISQLGKDQLLELAIKINNSAQLSRSKNEEFNSLISNSDNSDTISDTAKVPVSNCEELSAWPETESTKKEFLNPIKKTKSKVSVSIQKNAVIESANKVNNTVRSDGNNGRRFPHLSKQLTENIPVKGDFIKTVNMIKTIKSQTNVSKPNVRPKTNYESGTKRTSSNNGKVTSVLGVETGKLTNSVDEEIGSSVLEHQLECNERGFVLTVEEKKAYAVDSSPEDNELKQKKATLFSRNFKKTNMDAQESEKQEKSNLPTEESEIFRNVIKSCETSDGNAMKRLLQLEIESQRKRLSSKSSKHQPTQKQSSVATSKKLMSPRDAKMKSSDEITSPLGIKNNLTQNETICDSTSGQSPPKSTKSDVSKKTSTRTSLSADNSPERKTSVRKKESIKKKNVTEFDKQETKVIENTADETRKRERPKRFDDFVLASKPKKSKTRKFFFPKELPELTTNDFDDATKPGTEVQSNADDDSNKSDHGKSKAADTTENNSQELSPKQINKENNNDMSPTKGLQPDTRVDENDIERKKMLSTESENKHTKTTVNIDSPQSEIVDSQKNQKKEKNVSSSSKKAKRRKRKSTKLSVELEVLPDHLKTKAKAKVEDSVIDLNKVKLKCTFTETTFSLNESVNIKTFKLLTKSKWVCTLCGKPGNIGTLDALFGPYRLKVKSNRDANKDLLMNVWLHRDCAMWTSSICLANQTLVGLSDALEAAAKTSCCLCSQVGATLECGFKQCRDGYHFVCAKQRGCSFKMENFTITCPKHK